MEGIQPIQEELYREYIKQAESLQWEMLRRGIQFVTPTYPRYNRNFRVYVDGTAEVQTRTQPLLSRLGLMPKATKRIDLKSVGELLYHLTSEERFQEIPRDLDHIVPIYLRDLSSVLKEEENDCTRQQAPIEGI